MEELRRTNRFARRLAVAAVICCAASTADASEPPKSESGSASAFRNLLTEGWSSNAAKSEDRPATAKSSDVENQAAAENQAAIVREIESVNPAPKPRRQVGAFGQKRSAAIVRPRLRILEVPSATPVFSDELDLESNDVANAKKDPSAKDTTPSTARTSTNAAQTDSATASEVPRPAENAAPSTLAELIHRRTKPLRVPRPQENTDSIQYDVAPSVNRVDVERQVAGNGAERRLDSVASVKVAMPIEAEPVIDAKPTADVQAALDADPPNGDQVTVDDDRNVTKSVLNSGAGEADAEEIASTTNDAAEQSSDIESSEQATEAPATSAIAREARIEAPVRVPSPPKESAPTTVAATDNGIANRDIPTSVASDRSRRVANEIGFGLLPLRSLDSSDAVELAPGAAEESLTATIHTSRLRELARESLRRSSDRMRRQATHSAQKYAMEALRSIVAMQDSKAGGNQRAKQLDIAMDAIRESEDFCGRFGPVDERALQRMVGVHETDALKNRDLENVSALEATEAYLAVAKTNLIAAAGGVQEASDALVLLGKIEKQMAGPADTHAPAVAVTLQRAAIEIAPNNALAYQALGTTLLDQGLVKQSAWALGRSIEIQPTRIGYEGLLEAARRLGDVETARMCLDSLQNSRIANQTNVRKLEPAAFASTYKPNMNELRQVKRSAQPVEQGVKKVEPSRVSLRTLFPFSRR